MKPGKSIDPSDPFDLAQLVMHLRASSFSTGTRQYLTANQLFLELAAQGKNLYDIADEAALKELISYLRPIFCHSPEEQARFEDVLKDWLQYKPRRPPNKNIVRKYTNLERWVPFWSKLGRMIVGLVLVFLAIFMIQYWFWPKVIDGFITREDPATGKPTSVSQAEVRFKGQPIKPDNTGSFELKFNRISSPGELKISLQGYIEDLRTIDINQPSPIQIALKLERKELIITKPKEPIQIFEPIVLSLPRGPVGRTEITNWPLAASVSVAAGIASFLFLLVADLLRRRLVLKRLPAEKRPDLLKLAVASQWPEAFTDQRLRRLVGGLRRPRKQDVLEMDATQTVQASARAAGIFSPVMVHRKQMPEYLVLINRKSADDHQANIFYTLMEKFHQYDVSLACYYFRHDPRVCWRADNPLHRLLLSELAVIHHASTLFICSESALCFDPISGEPESWVKKLKEWPNRVLFTPDPPYHWTRQEWSLTAAGMIILPATATGLKTYAELSEEWRIEMLFPAEYSRAYPAIIGSDSMRWIDRKAPPSDTIKKLLRQLSGYLGPTSFVWLCACAIYPEISLPLTQYLFGAISKISGADGRPDIQLKSISSLARLPWFRYGYMPDWLRVTLINQLTAEQETAVRMHLEALLKHIAERKSKIRGKEGLHVASWVEPKDVLQTAPPDSPMGDCVFLGFMSGANLDRLVVEVPRRLGRWFQHLKRLPESEIPKAHRTLAQRLMAWFKSQMTFHRNLVRGAVSAVLSILVLLAVVQLFPEKIPFEEGRPKTIESVAFLRDRQILASAGADQFIKLWDASKGKELAAFKSDPMWIKSIAFSWDGKILASGGADQTVRLWDVDTGNEIKRFAGHSGMVFSVAFSPDGKNLASGGADRTVRLWDVATGDEIVTFEGHADSVFSVAFSPDGKNLASGGADRTVRLWDVATGNEIVTFAGHADSVFSVAFSPDGKNLASGGADRTIRLWDVATGKQIKSYAGHTGDVFSIIFSPDGKIFGSGGGDSTIIFWDVTTGEYLSKIIGGTENVYQLPLALNHTGNMLAAGIGHRISVWPINIELSKLPSTEPDVPDPPLIAPRILSFTINPFQIAPGASAVLRWETSDADGGVFLNGSAVDNSGSEKVSPKATTTYVLTAINQRGQIDRKSVKVLVGSPKLELVKQAQTLLQQLGYNPGVVDGIAGDRTTAAVKAFQRDANLVDNGLVDEKLLRALNLASKNMPTKSVPDVVGLSIESAIADLKKSGLKSEVKETSAGKDKPGTVLEQDPLPGTSVRSGTTIKLFVQAEKEKPLGKVSPDIPPLINLYGLDAEQTVYLDTLYIEGQVTGDEEITHFAINGEKILKRPSRQINFNQLVSLKPGINRFVLEAGDKIGRMSREEILVTYAVPEVQRLNVRLRVVLLPFEKRGEISAIGETVYDSLYSALVNQGRFQMVERSLLMEILQELKLGQTVHVDRETSVKLGKIAGADMVISGTVAETRAGIDVYAHCFDVNTSDILASANVYSEDLTLRDLKILMRGLSWKLANEFPIVEGHVLEVDGNIITLDRGIEGGIREGMKLIIFREGATLKDPDTGKIRRKPPQSIVEAQVVAAGMDIAEAKLAEVGLRDVRTLDKFIVK